MRTDMIQTKKFNYAEYPFHPLLQCVINLTFHLVHSW